MKRREKKNPILRIIYRQPVNYSNRCPTRTFTMHVKENN